MALIPVDPAEIATIVTTLEMRERPRPRPMPASPLQLVAWGKPDPAKYRMRGSARPGCGSRGW